MFQVTQRNGRRWSAADAFLRSALDRPNLELVTGATVHRARARRAAAPSACATAAGGEGTGWHGRIGR